MTDSTMAILIPAVVGAICTIVTLLINAHINRGKQKAQDRGEEHKADVEEVKVEAGKVDLIKFYQENMIKAITVWEQLYEKGKVISVGLLAEIEQWKAQHEKNHIEINKLESGKVFDAQAIVDRDKTIVTLRDGIEALKMVNEEQGETIMEYKKIFREKGLKL